MPIVNYTFTHEEGGLTKEQKEEIIRKSTELIVSVTGRGEKTTVVTINEISTDSYGIGGKTVTDIRKNS